MTAHNKALLVTGKLTEADLDNPGTFREYVYQKCPVQFSNLPHPPHYGYQRRRNFVPANPRTPAQQSRRALFRNAVSSWRAMSAASRRPWNVRASRLRMSGFNLWISSYLKQEGTPAL